MEEKRTLFDYLYRNLKEQILNGYYTCGEQLPSLNELCEIYHVGIRTAKDVIRALKEEGLIKTEERKPSYVTYCRPQCTPDTYLVQSVLKGRTSILQVYRTMELLLPAIYTFSLEVCSSDMQKLCFAQLYKDSRKDLRTRWKSASLSLYRLLDASGNLLFRDVLTHLELYARIPFFLEQEQEDDMDYKISESEWLLMEQLWQGEMTQAQLAEHLGKKWNKNTIHTFLTRLCKKGFAEVDRERSPHVYRAAVPREACEKQERESFLQRVYRGNVGNMVASFVKDNRLSAREAEALRKLLDECRRQETEPE